MPIANAANSAAACGTYILAQKSRVGRLISPEPVEQKDIETTLGRTRVFWLRRHLKESKPPLVLLHGWAAGSGCFFRNVQGLAPDRSIVMIDLPGFAESDRKELSEEPERDWAKALQEVFDSELGEPFWLAGHSFGGYLATLMSLEPKSRLQGLILLDAWGFPEMDGTFEEKIARLKLWQRCLYHTFKGLNWTGLDALRMLPKRYGPSLMKWSRKDLTAQYGEEFLDYVYEINSQTPASGEIAFSKLGAGFGFAKSPMEPRMLSSAEQLPPEVHFVYGGRSWMSSDTGFRIKEALEQSDRPISCSVSVVEGGTHHFISTHADELNTIINNILER